MGASSDDRKRVIVIGAQSQVNMRKTASADAMSAGAGVGGLATAARLAKAGVHVTVVEKNAYSGGRCSLLEKDGFRFDRGPSARTSCRSVDPVAERSVACPAQASISCQRSSKRSSTILVTKSKIGTSCTNASRTTCPCYVDPSPQARLTFLNDSIHYDDGEQVKLSTDMPTMKQEIERWEGSGGWARFLAFMDEVGNLAHEGHF